METTPTGLIVRTSERFVNFFDKKPGDEGLGLILAKFPAEKHSGVVSFTFDVPFIAFPNRSHMKTDWAKLTDCATRLSLLLRLCNHVFLSDETDGLELSDGRQLLLIETGCFLHERLGLTSPMSVGLSPAARKIAVDKVAPGADISSLRRVTRTCEAEVFNWYYGMSSSNQKDYRRSERSFRRYGGFGDLGVAIRSCGTPSFTVPGNCACLGANPDDFQTDGDLDSHNLDTPLQQLAMVCGVVNFWNKILKA